MEQNLDAMQPEELNLMMVPGPADSSKACLRLDEPSEELLPGIPNDIVLSKITPKLPWRAFYVLSLVSPAWLHAIRSHNVYNARVKANLTETLVLIKYNTKFESLLALCSMSGNAFHKLPPMKDCARRCVDSDSCYWVTMDGKVYAVGTSSGFLHVIDLAEQIGWKPCSNMQEEREDFGLSVIPGRIYVFGGHIRKIRFCGSEVYDRHENAWFPIKPMPSFRFFHTVTKVGEELFVHGGEILDPGILDSIDHEAASDDENTLCAHIQASDSLAVYCSVKDEWTLVKPFEERGETFFTAHGKLHCITSDGIYLYDIGENSWTHVKSHSFPAIARGEPEWGSFYPFKIQGNETGEAEPHIKIFHAVQAVGEEILAIVYLTYRFMRNAQKFASVFSCLVRSNGFTGENQKIAWQLVPSCPPLPVVHLPPEHALIGLIQL